MRAHGNKEKWIERKRTYYRAWLDRDPAYAPNRQFDDLLRFVFPEAPADLWRNPEEVLTRACNHSPTAAAKS